MVYNKCIFCKTEKMLNVVKHLYFFLVILHLPCVQKLEPFPSVISYILSGLSVYLAEKYIKQEPSESERPVSGSVADPL
jgi:hypothetical protein